MIITNANVFMNGRFTAADVRFDADKIIETGTDLISRYPEEEILDAQGNDLYPGFIDCHNHGGWNIEFMAFDEDSDERYFEQIKELSSLLPSVGVTTVYPTLSGTAYDRIARSVKLLRQVRSQITGARIADFQFEGVYPSLKRYMTPETVSPSKQHSDFLVDHDYSDVALFHVSPDLPGSIEWIDYIVSQGVFPVVGNTEASYEDVIKAADHGLNHADHMFNGFEAMHHRKEGAALAVMMDKRIKAQLTADGYHVAPAWVRFLIQCKGISNIYGVTDMSGPSGLSEGEHLLRDGRRIVAKDGMLFDENGYILSGNVSMNKILKAAREKCRLSKEEVALLYAENVASCLNISDRGKIEAGRKSDLVIMNDDYDVIRTIIGGKTVYTGTKQ